VDRLGPGFPAGFDDALGLQVALPRRGGTEAHRLVRQLDVLGFRVRVGEDGDRGHAHATRGADHAAGDLAAVGDQDLIEHGGAPP
jgi:hypothetical protein